MLVNDVAKIIEKFAPLQLQESYDNSGLCIGNPEQTVTGILLTIDITYMYLSIIPYILQLGIPVF